MKEIEGHYQERKFQHQTQQGQGQQHDDLQEPINVVESRIEPEIEEERVSPFAEDIKVELPDKQTIIEKMLDKKPSKILETPIPPPKPELDLIALQGRDSGDQFAVEFETNHAVQNAGDAVTQQQANQVATTTLNKHDDSERLHMSELLKQAGIQLSDVGEVQDVKGEIMKSTGDVPKAEGFDASQAGFSVSKMNAMLNNKINQ